MSRSLPGTTPESVFALIEVALLASTHLSLRQQAENVVEALGLEADSLHIKMFPGCSYWESDGSEVTRGRVWRCKGLEYEPKDPS